MKSFADIPSVLMRRRGRFLYRERRRLDSAQQVRPVVDGRPMLSFCSNDYLGLASHPAVAERFKQAIDAYGSGAGASHLVSGHHAEHEALERELAQLVGCDAALLFGTGYMANLGTIGALMERGDSVIQDKLNHASLLDGAQLSHARLSRYRHADVDHLRYRLTQATGKTLVVTDGVFSMDGDCAPLSAIAAACSQAGAWLMVDDAHGLGVLGDGGRGLLGQCGLGQEQVPLLVGTLGKAFGTAGAFVAGKRSTIDYLLQFARPYIYTTAAPPALAAATREALRLVREGDDRRAALNARIRQLRAGLASLRYPPMDSKTPIQPILVGDNDTALNLSHRLHERGLLVTAIRPPTVPTGSARLRITLSATHTEADVDCLLNTLEDLA